MSQSLISVVRAPKQARTTTRSLRAVPADEQVGSAWFPVCCVMLLLAGLAAVLGLNTVMAQDSFEVTRLETRSSVLADDHEALTHQIDARSAPQRLAEEAKDLGMVPATSPAFIDLGSGEVLGVAKPAEREAGLTVDAAAAPTKAAEKKAADAKAAEKKAAEKKAAEKKKADSQDSAASAAGD